MISAPWSRGQAGQTGDNDAARYGGAVLAGSSFDEGRGHFMLDVSWDKDDGLGSITVKEAFMEAQVPVFKQPPGADTLDLNAAIRHANYSTVGGVNT